MVPCYNIFTIFVCVCIHISLISCYHHKRGNTIVMRRSSSLACRQVHSLCGPFRSSSSLSLSSQRHRLGDVANEHMKSTTIKNKNSFMQYTRMHMSTGAATYTGNSNIDTIYALSSGSTLAKTGVAVLRIAGMKSS